MTVVEAVDSFTLTPDQAEALEAFTRFILDPVEQVFVLRGYSGCGKSTLVRVLLDRMPKIMKMARLINPSQKEYEIELTATTNKAAESLEFLTSMDVRTIHSFLSLRVQTDYRTQTTTLIPRSNQKKEGLLLFIDEASYIDQQLLKYIFELTVNCKIVFIGDPAQLTPVKSKGTPVFEAQFEGAALTQVVRQAEGNPIIDLSTKFRHTVNTGEFFSFKPDGHYIQHLNRDAFRQAIVDEFARPDWKYHDSKVLAWTNKCVIAYNQLIRGIVKGDPHFEVGDYAICNSFVTKNRTSLKTDQLVYINYIGQPYEYLGVGGRDYQVDGGPMFFQPDSLAAKNEAIKKARSKGQWADLSEMEQWIDLRAAYACTINKSQGSTFNKVFVDLDDVSRCNSGDQIARMLYVGVSRARSQVFLTGDLA